MNVHTMGPWIAQKPARQYCRISVGSRICATVWRDAGAGLADLPFEANAKLISAAPELLEALQSVLRDTEQGIVSLNTYAKANAVIAKATGAV